MIFVVLTNLTNLVLLLCHV